jgi:CBS domain-containing protein
MQLDVGNLCTREVVVATPDTPVREVAKLMRVHQVGDVVIVERRGDGDHPIGIVTDRDIVIRGVVEACDRVGNLAANELLAHPLVTIGEHDNIDRALEVMQAKGVRRVPVVDDSGILSGILSVDDLIECLGERLQLITRLFARGQQNEQRQRASA